MRHLSCFLLLLGCVMSSQLLIAQTETSFNCGTDLHTARRMATDSAYRNFVLKTKQALAGKVPDKQFDGTTYTIPVVFVVYHLGEAVGTGSNVSDAALQAQVTLMNQMYAANSANYPGPTANIQFTLARRTPDCQSFNGIVRVDGRSVANYTTMGLEDDPTQENQLRQLSGAFSSPTADKFVVIRVVHNITFAAGYAYFGGDMFVEAGGMTSATTYNKLLSHEMGHVLFLGHTFNQSETSTPGSYTCPPNANPSVDGDGVADTDPHKLNEPSNCYYQATPEASTAINSCTGQPFGWIGNNIMAYGCYGNRFTQGQIDRMREFLTTNNRNVGLSEYATPPAANEGLTAATCSVSTVNANSAGYSTGIFGFQLGGINKTSRGYPYYTGSYQNYACSDRTTVAAGVPVSFSITAVAATNSYRRIYIDYNNDGTFNETSELAFSANTGINAGSLTIPTTAVRNTYLRLRVVVDNGPTPPTACLLTGSTAYGYGEVEDYGIWVQSGTVCQSATAMLTGSQTVTAGQVASLSVVLTGNSPWSLTLNTGQTFAGITTSPFAFTVAPTTTTTYSVVALSNGCGAGTASGSAVVTISIPATTCTAPTTFYTPITAPNSATLSWAAIPGATGYLIRFRPDSYTTWPASNSFTTTNPTAVVGWSMGKQCDYQVQTLCANGNNSAFSAMQSFTTACLLPTATLSGSQTITAGQTATLTASVTGGDPTYPSYLIYLNNGQLFVFNNLSGSTAILAVSPTVSTTYSLASVSNFCRTGTVSGQAVVTVMAANTCTAPGSGSVTGFGPTFANLAWPNMGAGIRYNLLLRTTGAGSWTTVGLLTNSVHSLTALSPTTAYEWQIQTICLDGSLSAYSPVRSFTTTTCSQPYGLGETNLTANSVLLYWGIFTNTTQTLQWRAVGGTTWTSVPIPTLTGFYNLTGLSHLTMYEWQVRTNCPDNTTSPFTSPRSFTTPCLPPTVSLSPSQTIISGQTATLTATFTGTSPWSLTLNTGQTFTNLATSPFAFTVAPTATTIYSVAALRNGCGAGTASGSAVVTVQTVTTCTVPTTLPETNMTGISIRLNWQAIPGAIGYNYQYREVGTATWTSITLGGSTTNWAIYSTILGKTYEWQIRSSCANGVWSTFSPLRTFTMTCPVPFGQSEVLAQSAANLAWFSMYKPGGSSFTYNLQWRAVGLSTWTSATAICCSYYSVANLVPGQVYEWQLQTICPDGSTTAFTTSRTFTTGCSPPNYIGWGLQTSTSVQVSWPTLPGTTYEWQWRPTGNTATPYSSATGLTSSVLSITGLTNATQYEFRMRAVCSPTESSSFSPLFTVTTVCDRPSVYSAYSISPTSAIAQWANAGGATRYNLIWRAVGSPTSTTVSNLAGGNYSLTGLTPSTAYEYQVQTLCSDGNTSAYSNLQSFTTNVVLICTVPTNLTETEMTGTAIRLKWQAIPGAIGYNYQYREVGTATWTSITLGGPTTNWSISATLGKTYEWQIRGSCANGIWSAFSPLRTFTMTCPMPFGQSEVLAFAGAGLLWAYMNKPDGSSFTYNLQWRAVGASTWTSATAICCSSYNVSSLVAGQTYEWRLQTICPDGSTTTYTTSRTFTTGCSTPNYLSWGTRTSTSMQLYWPTPLSGSTYELQWRPTSNTATPYSSVTGLTSNQFSVTGLTNATQYEFRIRTVCWPTESSGFTPLLTLTTACDRPSVYSAYNISSGSAIAQWGNAGGGTRYNLIWRAVGSPASTTVSNLASGAHSLTGLMSSTAYEYQVQTVCSDGNTSIYSTFQSFTTTACTAPSGLTETTVGANYVYLRWNVTPNIYSLAWRVSGSSSWSYSPPQTVSYSGTYSYYLGNLTPGTTYEWQVESGCLPASLTSVSRMFMPQCSTPTLFYTPQTSATTARVSWSGSYPYAYQVRWRIQGTANWTTGNPVLNTTYTITGLTSGQIYEYQVQMVCEGTPTGYSPSQMLTTGCSTPGSFNVSTSSITNAGATVFWSGLSQEGTRYELQYRPQGSTSWQVLTNLFFTSRQLTGLAASTAYECQVRALCADGSTSAFASTTFVTTGCTVPTSLTEVGVFPNSASLRFGVSIGNTYLLQWRQAGVPTWTNSQTYTATGNGTIQLSISGLTVGSVYEWQVQAVCGPGLVSGFSAPRSFTTGCTIPTSLFVSTPNSTSAQVYWTGGSYTYQVRWKQSTQSTWTESPPIVNVTYLNINGLTPSTTYEWQVQMICNGQATGYSASATFTTADNCPVPLSVYASAVTSNAATLYVSIPATNTPIELQWRLAGSSAWPNSVVLPTGTNTQDVTSLLTNAGYELRARSVCAGGSYSAYRTGSFNTSILNGDLFTIAAGNWTDSAIWSLGRVPNKFDSPELRHVVTLPNYNIGVAYLLRYKLGGQLIYGIGARLRLGF